MTGVGTHRAGERAAGMAEEQRFEEAAASLERAVALMPDRPRVRRNLGLVLQRLGRP